jgi:peptidoglycan DL-endopeptidase LytF
MNRRDTIIVAVLINAGLLVMLFISALKTPSATQVAQMDKPSPPQEKKKVEKKSELIPVKGDGADKALAKYKQAKSVEKEIVTPLPKVEKVVAKAPEPQKKQEVPVAKVAPPTVTVKKGDMLEKIARVNGTTVTEIMRLNKLTTARLQIGQKLLLPQGTVAKKNAPDAKYYVVKNGDNLWKIAIENHLKVEQLLRLNNLDEKKAKKLRPGDKLLIR